LKIKVAKWGTPKKNKKKPYVKQLKKPVTINTVLYFSFFEKIKTKICIFNVKPLKSKYK
jgi:hypothetical protein